MLKMKLGLIAAVAAGALAMPATGSAQGLDVGQLCHSLVGSGTTNVTVASVDRCLAASEPEACTLSDTINVFDLVVIHHGICVDVDVALEERTVYVNRVATIKLLP